MSDFTFYLGTHHPGWLREMDIPLFVSRRRLAGYRTLPRARGRWILDSGGFTELSLHGKWTVPLPDYVTEVYRFAEGVGNMEYAAPQDWMCEPQILKSTGLTVLEHQSRTVHNFLDLREAAPDIPWMPVLQGWVKEDYFRCVDLYDAAGVDLRAFGRVGVGTVCRRQHTKEALDILTSLSGLGLRLHAFGFKKTGLREAHKILVSADSLAWSFHARRQPPLSGCTGHKNCANCSKFALRWYQEIQNLVEEEERCQRIPA